MSKYELGLVVSPELEEENLNQVLNRVTQWITDGAGQVTKVDQWGKRRLAFPIKKFRDGYYVFIYTDMQPGAVRELERNLNITEPVLRHLVIRVDEE